MPLSRREFLLRSGLGVTAGAIAGAAAWPRGAPAADVETPPDLNDWEAVRNEFDLSRDWIHLAGLLLASHPRPVREAIERHRRGLDDNPPHYLYGGYSSREGEVRQAAARYLGARPAEIALTDSTTMGLGLVYNGLALRPGQEILTTEHDHRATHESLRFKAERSGASLRRIPLYRRLEEVTEEEIVETLSRAVQPRTRVVAVTWVHSSTGLKLPIGRIAQALERVNAGRAQNDRVIFCVDGVHAFGVEDGTVSDLGCDFLMAGTHKWLFGPRGTGIVWGNPRAQAAVAPTIPSFTRDGSWGGEMTPGGFHSFEHRWALKEAFEFHQRLGKARVAARIHELNRQLKEGLAGMPNVKLHTPMPESLSAGLVCFDVRGMSPGQVVQRLRQQGIIGSTTPYATSYARLTPGLLNSPEEIEAALRAVRALA
jgi:selenocysteine lyase/cysteine desulfurase